MWLHPTSNEHRQEEAAKTAVSMLLHSRFTGHGNQETTMMTSTLTISRKGYGSKLT